MRDLWEGNGEISSPEFRPRDQKVGFHKVKKKNKNKVEKKNKNKVKKKNKRQREKRSRAAVVQRIWQRRLTVGRRSNSVVQGSCSQLNATPSRPGFVQMQSKERLLALAVLMMADGVDRRAIGSSRGGKGGGSQGGMEAIDKDNTDVVGYLRYVRRGGEGTPA